jgi:hypothetical protein
MPSRGELRVTKRVISDEASGETTIDWIVEGEADLIDKALFERLGLRRPDTAPQSNPATIFAPVAEYGVAAPTNGGTTLREKVEAVILARGPPTYAHTQREIFEKILGHVPSANGDGRLEYYKVFKPSMHVRRALGRRLGGIWKAERTQNRGMKYRFVKG